MPIEINQESRYQFLSTIEKAMTLLDRVGHITDYNDLDPKDHIQANDIHSELYNRLKEGANSDAWIQAGVPLGEIEKARLYFQWYARLHVAGVYDHDDRAICADCLPDDQWGFALPLQGTKEERFKVIPRGKAGESFYCEECRKVIKI